MDKKIRSTNLSVVLPAYKDELTIGNVVTSLIDYIKPALHNLEIIIVEDGSPDNTPTVCDALAKRYQELRVIHHETNMGYGKTLIDGFEHAIHDLIFYTDGDSQYDLSELLTALEVFDTTEIDALIGYRHPRRDGIIRWIISKIYNLLFKILFFVSVKDVNCSFKLIKRNVVKNLHLNSESAFIDAQIILRLKKNGFRIKEMAVRNFPNRFRRSHFINPRLILEMLYEMFKERLFT